MKYQILKEIISLAEAFEEETQAKEWRREFFTSWLIESFQKKKEEPGSKAFLPQQDGLIAMFIGMMYKYASFYSKRVLKDSKLYSLDDFGVIASLFPHHSFRKVDVLKQTIMEKSSGNEVLKRLLKEGLIQESENPEDKRSKLLSLTDEGRTAFIQLQAGMSKLSAHVTGNLSSDEKTLLLKMLSKLHTFHQPYFEENDEETLAEILNPG